MTTMKFKNYGVAINGYGIWHIFYDIVKLQEQKRPPALEV